MIAKHLWQVNADLTPAKAYWPTDDTKVIVQRFIRWPVEHRLEQKSGWWTEYIDNYSVIGQDWDWPDAIHPTSCVSVEHLGDVVQQLLNYLEVVPKQVWRVYLTPGGVRAYCLSHRGTPDFWASTLQQQLKSDPLYAEYCASRRRWSFRISPKNRPEDFVAFPILELGQGAVCQATELLVRRFHDIPAAENRVLLGMPAYGLPDSGLQLLKAQLTTVRDGGVRRSLQLLANRLEASLSAKSHLRPAYSLARYK